MTKAGQQSILILASTLRGSVGNSPMAKKKNPTSARPIDLDLRFKPTDKPIDPLAKRFDIFLIDTGWNHAVGNVVQSQLSLLFGINNQDSFYILSHDQSVELIRRAPHLIGHDPIILVYDVLAPGNRKSRGYHGFRSELGVDQASPAGAGAVTGISPFRRSESNCGSSGSIGPG